MWIDNKSVKRFELVNINIAAGSTTPEFYFPDLPNLTNAKIEKISVYYNNIITKSPQNISLISSADLANTFLILSTNDKEEIKMPINNLVSLGNPGLVGAGVVVAAGGYLPIHDKIIQWSKSYVRFTSAYAGTAFTVQIGVFYYYDEDKKEHATAHAAQQAQPSQQPAYGTRSHYTSHQPTRRY